MSAVPCRLCWAQVDPWHGDVHREWHVVNQLHAADCEHLRTAIAQRFTGAYLTPRSCTCGIGTDPTPTHRPARATTPQEGHQ